MVYIAAQRQGAFHEFTTRSHHSHRGNERALRWQVWFLPTKYTVTPGASPQLAGWPGAGAGQRRLLSWVLATPAQGSCPLQVSVLRGAK